jgi:hypothetical protein
MFLEYAEDKVERREVQNCNNQLLLVNHNSLAAKRIPRFDSRGKYSLSIGFKHLIRAKVGFTNFFH